MFDLDHWQEIWTALAKNRLRTFLTAFGVFWGIFLLVLLLGSGLGLQNGIDASFAGSATNSFFCWGMRTSKPFAGLPAGREVRFTNADTAAIERQVPEARVVAPRLQLGGWRGGATVVRGPHSWGYSVYGDMPEIATIESLAILRGRFLNHLDVAEQRKVAVIGERVEETLFDRGENPIGEGIEINGVRFTVIGTFRSRQVGRHGNDAPETLHVPFSTFQQAFNAGDEVHWYAVTSVEGVSASVVEDKVLDLLHTRHKVARDDRRGIGSFNLEEEFEKMQGLFAGIRLLMWVVGIGTLAAGAIGVSNIMLIIVRERTAEIGIRRAVGATPWKVQGQIVLEAVSLTLVAGLLGLAAGVGVLELVNALMPPPAPGAEQMFLAPGVEIGSALKALFVLALAGTLAGLAPARRAVAVDPVVALRTEA